MAHRERPHDQSAQEQDAPPQSEAYKQWFEHMEQHPQELTDAINRSLLQILTPPEASRWLGLPNAALDGETPIHAIQNGRGITVLEILIQIEQGIHI